MLAHGASHCCVGLTLPPPAAKSFFIFGSRLGRDMEEVGYQLIVVVRNRSDIETNL